MRKPFFRRLESVVPSGVLPARRSTGPPRRGPESLALKADLHGAAERGELLLHFQPQFDLDLERVTGVESLVRWRHPVRGLVPPGAFIPLAEESGLIAEIGDWVLREACVKAGLAAAGVRLSVRPRGRAAAARRRFGERVRAVLDDAWLPPAALVLATTGS